MAENKESKNEVKVIPQLEKTIAGDVLNRLALFQQRREINLPQDYSPANALKSAWLTILETEDRNKKPALEVCSQPSIANALLKMVIQGLSPAKMQCYFVVHGSLLTMMRSYQGTKAVAKRVAGIKDVLPKIIYEGDIFEYENDVINGRQRVTKHTQKFENINDEKITGCYATVIEGDNSTNVEIMTIAQVRKAWAQGYDSLAKKNFPGEMCKKTITYRACKNYINSSNDADLFKDGDEDEDNVVVTVAEEIKENGNKENLTLPENTTVVQPEKIKREKEKETVKKDVTVSEVKPNSDEINF